MTFDIPNKDGLWVFNSPMSTNREFTTWVKPTQYNNFIFYVCGAGGGGSSGTGTGGGTARGGGAGGGGGQLTILNAPSYLLPEVLYINVGKGGLGAQTTGTLGAAGGTTYLCYYPNTQAANIIAQGNGANGTANAASAGTGANAGAGIAPTINQTIFSVSAMYGSQGGNGASASTSGANGNDFTSTVSCIYGGAGGGSVGTDNVAYNGGGFPATSLYPRVDGGIGSRNSGCGGFLLKKPFTSIGGSGGASNDSVGAAGTGGNGSWGSGGGGGGGGLLSKGGNGGDGFVIIIGY